MSLISQFLMGAVAMGLATSGLFFLRFWRESGNRLFGWFALAFFILASNRVMLAVDNEPRETSLVLYLVRLLAFLMIIWAIVETNYRKK